MDDVRSTSDAMSTAVTRVIQTGFKDKQGVDEESVKTQTTRLPYGLQLVAAYRSGSSGTLSR